MGLLTGLCAFLYHLPQIYKWLLKPYYITSFLLTISFVVVRKTPGLCEHLVTQREDGNSCDFDWYEGVPLLFIHCSLLFVSSVTVEQHIGNLLMFSKVANCILFFRMDIRFGILYLALLVFCFVLTCQINQPSVFTLETAVYLSHVSSFILCSYNCTGLRFGKIDIGRYEEVSKKYRVSTSPLAKQLPSTGREVDLIGQPSGGEEPHQGRGERRERREGDAGEWFFFENKALTAEVSLHEIL
uniref:Thioredoxin-related transmembrane protein 2a n=1 Tax=Haplochromis burtoni TaxID=8153 RepID=A0A3Q2VDV1_HAPBU